MKASDPKAPYDPIKAARLNKRARMMAHASDLERKLQQSINVHDTWNPERLLAAQRSLNFILALTVEALLEQDAEETRHPDD